jgi:hypothetical protein
MYFENKILIFCEIFFEIVDFFLPLCEKKVQFLIVKRPYIGPCYGRKKCPGYYICFQNT